MPFVGRRRIAILGGIREGAFPSRRVIRINPEKVGEGVHASRGRRLGCIERVAHG